MTWTSGYVLPAMPEPEIAALASGCPTCHRPNVAATLIFFLLHRLICVLNSRFILDLQEANACLNSTTGISAGPEATSLGFAASPGSDPASFGGQSSQIAPTEFVEPEGAQIAEV